MSNTTRLRGAFWPQDAWGRIGNAAIARERLAAPLLDAADEAVDLALERFGEGLHSVYLSGPAARGRPGGAAFFALLRLGARAGSTDSWETVAAAEMRRRHSLLGRTAFAVFAWKDVFTTDGAFSSARFRMAVNSICLAGRNMNRMLPPQKLDRTCANADILAFRSRMAAAAERLAAARTQERVRAAALDAGHAVLSAGFSLVIEREQVYTEDLDLRRDLFLVNHPTRRRDMYEAYAFAIRPPADPARALAFIERVGAWMGPMTDAWLNGNNPDRAERLRG